MHPSLVHLFQHLKMYLAEFQAKKYATSPMTNFPTGNFLNTWLNFFPLCFNVIFSPWWSKSSISKPTFLITFSLNIDSLCLLMAWKIFLDIACLTLEGTYICSKRPSRHATHPFIAPWDLSDAKPCAASSSSSVVSGNLYAKSSESKIASMHLYIQL